MNLQTLLISKDDNAAEVLSRVLASFAVGVERFSEAEIALQRLGEQRFDGLIVDFDEPEAALLPNRQLSFLVRMHELIGQRPQFIIATHSPIILGYPDAWIYQTTPNGLERVGYEDTEHFQVTRNFLNPAGFR